MGGFPGPKVHRRSRRKLGRGQYPQYGSAKVVPTFVTTAVTLTFDRPVIVSGPLAFDVAGGDDEIVSQEVLDSQHVLITLASTAAGKSWAFNGLESPVRTYQGGGVASASGTFSA